jgi:hypothetical protein
VLCSGNLFNRTCDLVTILILSRKLMDVSVIVLGSYFSWIKVLLICLCVEISKVICSIVVARKSNSNLLRTRGLRYQNQLADYCGFRKKEWDGRGLRCFLALTCKQSPSRPNLLLDKEG